MASKRIYTRGGDGGKTSLAGGRRVRKDSPRIECCGALDELNSFAGLARESAEKARLARLAVILLRIQYELFDLGAILAAPSAGVLRSGVARLEAEIDEMSQELPPLDSFVLPGGSRLNAELHVCRTVCRRAERLVVALAAREPVPAEALQYLNRLSDAFFVFARWASLQLRTPETLWDPNRPASA